MKKTMMFLCLSLVFLLCVSPMFASLDLINAAWNGDLVKVNRLIKSGANVNTLDNYNWSALMYAVSFGNGRRAVQETVYMQIAQLLISKGADIHVVGNKYTALTLCAKFGNSAMMRILASRGANINITAPEVNYSAIMWAAARNNQYALETLIGLGAKLKGKGIDGNNALHLTCQQQTNLRIIYLLLKTRDGININEKNSEGDTPLIIAAKKGNSSVVQFLLKNGAEVNTVNLKGETALMHACYAGNQNTIEHIKVVSILLGAYPDINIQDNNGKSALMWATGLQIVKLICQRDNGANVSLQDKQGKTALIRAVEFNLIPILKYLIAFRANVNTSDNSSRTALDYAMDRPSSPYNQQVINILKQAGAKRWNELGH